MICLNPASSSLPMLLPHIMFVLPCSPNGFVLISRWDSSWYPNCSVRFLFVVFWLLFYCVCSGEIRTPNLILIHHMESSAVVICVFFIDLIISIALPALLTSTHHWFLLEKTGRTEDVEGSREWNDSQTRKLINLNDDYSSSPKSQEKKML